MKTQVLIIGGGIAGLALSHILAQKKISVVVTDRSDFEAPQQDNGRTIALMGSSIDLIQQTGVWDELKDVINPLEVMQIIDDSNPAIHPVEVKFHANEIGKDQFGFNIPNQLLRYLLAKMASDNDYITVLSGTEFSNYSVKDGSALAQFSDGKEIEAQLIVGADGRFSKVREVAGIKTEEHDYGQSAITCIIEHSNFHNNTSTERHRPGGPFTNVPLPDLEGKYRSSIVWVEKTEDSQDYITLGKEHFEQALQDRTKGSLGKIKLTSTPQAWPLKGMRAKDLIVERVALIAEAAHAFTPLGAQGLNLSLRDIRDLSSTIFDALSLGQDIGSTTTLRQYERARHPDILSRYKGINFYNGFISNDINALRGLRRLGINTLNRTQFLKEFAMNIGLAA